MKRRQFVAGSLALAAGGAWLARPGDNGQPHDDYFATLNALLKASGPMRPVMLVDLDRLDTNIAVMRRHAPAGKHIRLVAKSLPSPGLLDYIQRRMKSRRLMVFHQPFLNAIARQSPDADVLLGKPIPVRSAQLFYDSLAAGSSFDPAQQLQWLIDTPERLAEYLQLARARRTPMRVNIELDVGLHRGGVVPGEQLAAMLALISGNPEQLDFSGFMGYDPHVVKVPGMLASRDALLAEVEQIYTAATEQVRQSHPRLLDGALTMNTAGSPTYRLHGDERYSTEVAIGSALVKPSDFDLDTLTGHVPAAFIATPMLKANDGIRVPAADGLSRVIRLWDRNQRRGYFTYGGKWMADYVSPAGLKNSGLYGRSSNQDLVLGSEATGLEVGDHVFLRPTQSEFVMLQFGDLLAVRGGQIVDQWPVLG